LVFGGGLVTLTGRRTGNLSRDDGARRGEGLEQFELTVDDRRESTDAGTDRLLVRVTEREPDVVAPAPVGIERGAGGECDQLLDGAGEHLLGVERLRQLEPHVEPAVRHGPLHLGQMFLQRGEERIAATTVHIAEGVDLTLPIGAAQVLRDGELAERAGAEDRRLVRENELLSDRVGCKGPPHPEPRREGLREGAEVDDPVLLDRAHGVRRRGIEVQQAVGIVLEHQDVVRAADLEDLESTLPREGDTGRVVERRDRVEELDPLALGLEAGDGLAEGFGDQPVLVHEHMGDLGLVGAEDTDRPDIARSLGEDDVARVDEELRHEVEGLLRPRRHDDIVDAAPDTLERHDLEDLLPEFRGALTRAVLQRGGTTVAHDPLE
jgi:hypothetical protein